VPLYEYECTQCKSAAEILQRHGAAAPVCDPCAKVMRKMISRSSFALKGAGWERDGYATTQRESPGE